MNELVRLNTNDVSKAIPVTDSNIIADKFEVSHISVVKLIEKYSEDLTRFGKLTSFQMTRDNSQRSSKFYELNEMQFSLLVMYMKNTKTAREFKIKFVEAFFLMKNELQARSETRYIGKSVRKELTDTIKSKVKEEGSFKRFAYSNYSKLVYKKVLGMTVKKAKEQRGLKEKDNIRNFLTIDELKQVQELESKIAYYIEMRTGSSDDDKEVYYEVKKYIEQERED